MLVTVFTVTMLALSVIMLMIMLVIMSMIMIMSVNRFMAVVLVLKTEGQSSLMLGCHVEPVFLLQSPLGLIPLCLQLRHSSTDKLLLYEDRKRWVKTRVMTYLIVLLSVSKTLKSV